jgi:hypothetical protein
MLTMLPLESTPLLAGLLGLWTAVLGRFMASLLGDAVSRGICNSLDYLFNLGSPENWVLSVAFRDFIFMFLL